MNPPLSAPARADPLSPSSKEILEEDSPTVKNNRHMRRSASFNNFRIPFTKSLPCPPSLSANQLIIGVLEAFSGPGSKALPAEIMRQLPFPGPGGPTGLGSPRRLEILAGATGGPPMGPPHLAEARLILQEKGSPGRCFLRATPLTPSYDKGYLKVKGGKMFFPLALPTSP